MTATDSKPETVFKQTFIVEPIWQDWLNGCEFFSRNKWLWVWIPWQSLKCHISRMLWARNSLDVMYSNKCLLDKNVLIIIFVILLMASEISSNPQREPEYSITVFSLLIFFHGFSDDFRGNIGRQNQKRDSNTGVFLWILLNL